MPILFESGWITTKSVLMFVFLPFGGVKTNITVYREQLSIVNGLSYHCSGPEAVSYDTEGRAGERRHGNGATEHEVVEVSVTSDVIQ